MAAGHESGPTPSGGAPPQAATAAARRRRRLWWVAAGSLAFLALGAALFVRQALDRQRVETDLDLAAAAFAGARGADARELAPDEWLVATTGIDDAMAELHRQDGRFVLVRACPRVHELLAKAIDAADAAKAAAESAREAAEANGKQGTGLESPRSWGGPGFTAGKDEARAAIDAAKSSLAKAVALLASLGNCQRALRAREIRNDLETVKRNIQTVKDVQLVALETRFTSEDFPGAKAAADTLKGTLDPLIKDMEGIATKFKCK